MENLKKNRIYWIVGLMGSGKTYFSKYIGSILKRDCFKLDDINSEGDLINEYSKSIKTGLVEGYTPLRCSKHYKAIMKVLEGYDIKYILIKPRYEQWLKNREERLLLEDDYSVKIPYYTKEKYIEENNKLLKLEPIIIISSKEDFEKFGLI